MFTLPENLKVVQGHEPVAANALADCDYVSCKNVKKLWAVLHHYSAGGDTDLVLTINEATAVAATGEQAITEVCPIWYNIDTASADALARATDAYAFTVDTGAGLDQLWILEWDPALFSAGYDCFSLSSSGGNASNIVSVLYFLESRYASDVPPAAITD